MNIDGKHIVSSICNRLKVKGVLKYDSNIKAELELLSKYEVSAIMLGCKNWIIVDGEIKPGIKV